MNAIGRPGLGFGLGLATSLIPPPALGQVLIVDRIEGETAVVELDAESWLDIPLNALPQDVREGDRIRMRLVRSPPQGWSLRWFQRTTPVVHNPSKTGDSDVQIQDPRRRRQGRAGRHRSPRQAVRTGHGDAP